MEGSLNSKLSFASEDCKVDHGSIVCSDAPTDGSDFIPYFFESRLDLNFSNMFGTRDEIRSLTEFYHPYEPYSGLTFQAFSGETLLGEIAGLEATAIFAPSIILYTRADKRTQWFGETFSRVTFRRFKSSVDFELVGTQVVTTLVLDDWKDEPGDSPNTHYGMIVEVSGGTKEELRVNMESRLGVKGGATCFGNCLGPMKLQQNAVQEDFGFEELLISVDNFALENADLSLSSKITSDHGFNHFTVSGSKTWSFEGYSMTLSSNFIVTSNSISPLAGTSVTWTAEPLIFSIYFDETMELENTSQVLQFNPDVSELGIDGLNFGNTAALGNRITTQISLPTDPVEFNFAFRFSNADGAYAFSSGVLSAALDQEQFGVKGILAFREHSRIVRLETDLKF